MALPPPWLTRLARALGLAALEGASLGFAAWALLAHAAMPAYARENTLEPALRMRELGCMGLGVVAVLAAAGWIFATKRRQGMDFLERGALRLAPIALSGPAVLVLDWRLWPGRDAVFYTLVLALGLGLQVAFVAAWDQGRLFDLERLRGLVRGAGRAIDRYVLGRVDLPLVAVLLGSCGYAVYFSAITITNHRNLGTTIDLAIENNLMWNLVHGGPLFKSTPFSPTGSHLGHHATFFSYVLAPVYLLAPRPETLLAIQATLLGAAALPLFLYARRHVPPWIAAVVAWAYLVYPPLHGANLYDFHYLPLGIPCLWWVLYALESRQRVMALVAVLVTMSVREDVAGSLAVIGVFLLLTGTAAIEGVVMTVVAGSYAVVLKLLVMPKYKDGVESFVNQYEGLLPKGGSGFGGVLETIVGNPPFTANVAIEKDKVAYALQIFAPILALPLRAPRWWLLLLPGFAFTLLSTAYPPLIQISFQYTAYWIPFVFIGVVLALERAGERGGAGGLTGSLHQRAVVAGLVFASVASTAYQGAFTRHETVHSGFRVFQFQTTADDLRRREHLASLLALIPADSRVAASEILVPHVSSRQYAYKLRNDVWDADYLLFETPVDPEAGRHALPPLKKGEFGVVSDLGDMVLAQRGISTDLNGAFLKRIGQ